MRRRFCYGEITSYASKAATWNSSDIRQTENDAETVMLKRKREKGLEILRMYILSVFNYREGKPGDAFR